MMILTVQDVIERIHTAVAEAGSLRALAVRWRVTGSYIGRACRGKDLPGPGILRPLGLEAVRDRGRVVGYREKGD
jgi:hypothetical protein